MPLAETIEHEGITIEIHYDEDGRYADPRDADNLTTMVCWHPDYVLGDEQVRGERGAVDNVFESERGNTEIRSMRHLERYLRIARKAINVCPLYLYDHSGISIRAGSPSPWDSPTVRRDEYGAGMGWDTSMVGFVYTTHERVTELCGEDEKYHEREWIAEQVAQDVKLYDMYLRGEVYGYVVAPGTEDEESCWGYLGDPHGEGGMIEGECKPIAAAIAKERREARALPWLPTWGKPILTAVQVAADTARYGRIAGWRT